MPTRPFLALTIVVIAMAVAACSSSISNPGHAETEHRTVAGFTKIVVGNAIRVDVRIAPTQSIAVTADPSVLPHVMTTVSDGRLAIAMDGSSNHLAPVHVEVSAAVTAIEAGTSAQVTVAGVSSDAFRVAGAQSATVEASGTAGQLDVSGVSSARFLLSALQVDTAQVDLGSSATAEIRATQSVLGAVHESAQLRILGSPGRVEVRQATSGTVERG